MGKGKLKAGQSVKGKKAAKQVKGKKAKAGAGIKRLAEAGIRELPMGGLGLEALGLVKDKLGGKKQKGKGFAKRRKGKIPKSVKKWARRITTRRKQEEKLIKSLFGSEGGKVIKKTKRVSSVGYITPEERMNALRR